MRKNNSFVLREIYGRALLIPICKNKVSNDPIFLNNVASDVWKNVENGIDRVDLLERISIFYDLSDNSIEKKAVDDFISNMVDLGILIEEDREIRNV